jgi:predicted nucleotidyltransferase
MGLLSIIKNKPEMRSLFGERELKIIEKQLWGIKLSPSERTRLSRDIRKKFRAIREIANFADEKELKHGSRVKELIADMKERILESEYSRRIKKIVLFGSTAINQRTYRSDIDISVEFDTIDLKEATEFRIKFNYNDKIDVQVYNVLPDKIKKEIDEYGKIIWKRK